jgi:hypothetical protein
MNGHDPEKDRSMTDSISKKSQALFEQTSENLDPAIGNRLRLMRREALANDRPRMPQRWLPLGAAAATILAIGLTWWLPQRGTPQPPAANTEVTTDVDLLPDDDTEMYAWLGDAPVATDDGKAQSQ